MGIVKSIVKVDCDDVMWDLCKKVTQLLRLNFDHWTDFKVRDIPKYTDEEKDLIFEAFQDVETFKQLRFYPGVDKISRIRDVDGIPVIKSSSLSENVIEYKEWILTKEIPGITKANLELNLVAPGSTVHKQYEADVLIAADDNPYNIANSLAQINMMPVWQPWSHTKKAIQTVAEKNVIWMPSFSTMMDYAYQQCQLRQYQQSNLDK